MRMGSLNVKTHLSHSTFFNRSQAVAEMPRRNIRFAKKFIAVDEKGSCSSLICQTENNIKPHESTIDYQQRSLAELGNFIPASLQKKQLFVIKVRQAVINPQAWHSQRAINVINYGHISGGIFKFFDSKFVAIENTLMSKQGLEQPFESDTEIINSFFTSQKQYLQDKEKGANEYYWLTNVDFTCLSIHGVRNAIKKLKQEKKPWNAKTSACSQAFYEAYTGIPLEHSKSPQTAANATIRQILVQDDKILLENLENMVIDSGISTSADELGAILLRLDYPRPQ
jgi:hypothetical protein